jgi:orotate phosphoribosyltransferase
MIIYYSSLKSVSKLRLIMNKLTLAKEIYQISNIKGNFTLRSQQQTTEYFDKYLFEAQPKLLFEIARQLVALIPENIDILAGLEMGGIPIATALSLQTGIPLVFVRKKAKTYGTCKLAEGGEVKNKRILIVEDIVTSGGAAIDAVTQLRELGATIEQAVCVIDRESFGAENLKNIGVKLMPLFTKSDLQSSSC